MVNALNQILRIQLVHCFESVIQFTADSKNTLRKLQGDFLSEDQTKQKKVSALLFSSILQSVMQATVTTQACSLLTENRDFINKIADVAENFYFYKLNKLYKI